MVRLVSHPAGLEAVFAPQVGMVGASLRHHGEELTGQRGGLRAYSERGSSFGIPLLHPWANRLGSRRYRVGARTVELDPARSPVRLDPHGLPIHGLLAASPHWEVLGVTEGEGQAGLAARLDFAARPELMAGFPFSHELHVQVELRDRRLELATVVLPTAGGPVPVSFGWHPCLRLPGVHRRDWHVELPVKRRQPLDHRGLPTGSSEPVAPESGPLRERSFDDLFTELERPARFALEGDGRRIELEVGDGYRVAQVYAPPGSDFICFEPMTAPTNALVAGGYELVEPGDSYRAGFSITVLDQ